MGPWHLGHWYRPLAAVTVLGCVVLLVIGMQPPNEKTAWIVGGVLLTMAIIWFARAKDRFARPPEVLMQKAGATPDAA